MIGLKAKKALHFKARSARTRTASGVLAIAWIALQVSCVTQTCNLDEIYSLRTATCHEMPCPPGPPQEGAGSGQSLHRDVKVEILKTGPFDAHRSVIYTPASPVPTSAPVILFLHGYFDTTPEKYDAMLRHYARKGFIVIYPSYGNGLTPNKWAENAEGAWNRAIQHLESHGSVRPDLSRVAFIGHSIGGLLALHLAQKEASMPVPSIRLPKLIIASEAAGTPSPAYPHIVIDDLSRIPKSTHLLLLMAEETFQKRLTEKDQCETKDAKPSKACDGFTTSRHIYQRTAQIPTRQKSAVLIPSESRGKTVLKSEHNGIQGECTPGGKPLDAIDTWGYWRWTVEALNQTLKGQSADLEGLRSERILANGTWSDGQAAKPAVSLDACFSRGECPKL